MIKVDKLTKNNKLLLIPNVFFSVLLQTSVSIEKIETVHRFRRQPVPYEASRKVT